MVLPYINMHPPRVYMCSPSWTPLPPPSPYHASRSSQCTCPKLPVSCIEPGLNFALALLLLQMKKLRPRRVWLIYSFTDSDKSMMRILIWCFSFSNLKSFPNQLSWRQNFPPLKSLLTCLKFASRKRLTEYNMHVGTWCILIALTAINSVSVFWLAPSPLQKVGPWENWVHHVTGTLES